MGDEARRSRSSYYGSAVPGSSSDVFARHLVQRTIRGTFAGTFEDCSVDYVQRQASWSDEKKTWCCRNEGRGCERFDCHDDVPRTALATELV